MEVPKLLRWALAVVLLLACARFGLPRALPLAERGDPALLEQRATEKAQELGYGVSGRPLRLTYVDVKQITTWRWQLPDRNAQVSVDASGEAVAWRGPNASQHRKVAMPHLHGLYRRGMRVSAVGVVAGALLGLSLMVLSRRRRWHWRYGLGLGGTALIGILSCRLVEVDRMLWGLKSGDALAPTFLRSFLMDAALWGPIVLGTAVAAACVGPPKRWGSGALSGLLVTAALFALAGVLTPALEQAGFFLRLQPQHLLNELVDSRLPWVSVVGYSLFAVAVEETLFRRLGTGLLFEHTRNAAFSILVPALCFGLTHASVDFLPPADPLVRAGLMTLVGVFWGWLYLRKGLAAVVASHLAADLLLLSWPLWGVSAA